MFEDKLKEIITDVYCGKVIVASNYVARESLYAKGITPAIFLHHFYEKKYHDNKVFYVIKEKGYRDMCDILPIDIEEYECFRDDRINKLMRDRVISNYKLPKPITKQDLINTELCEAFLKGMHFYWFEEACKIFLYAMTLDEDNHKISTLEQPLGMTFIIEIQPNTNIKAEYEKIRKEAEVKLKKMFAINPLRIRTISILVIILYNCEKKVGLGQARTAAEILKSEYKIDANLICCVEINGANSKDVTEWSSYPRPILKIEYRLKLSDPIRLIGENEQNLLRQFVNNHRERIKQYVQDRLLYLSKRYEESNTVKRRIGDFFKSTPQLQKSYNLQESECREIADIMFILGDYKRCMELYKSLAEKFKDSNRDQLIFYNLSEMIQLSKALNCLAGSHNNKLKVYESIQSYADQLMFKRASGIHKYKLHRYLIYILYFLHGFRIFNKDFIKGSFYYYIKKVVNEQSYANSQHPSIIPAFIHEQFANLNLLYPVPEYRRYCYDLVRVASKFNEFKLYQHHLRCLTIANYIYENSFPLIERYVNLTLSKTYLQLKNPREALAKYKKTWRILINSNQGNSNNEEDSQFLKLSANNGKIVLDVQKMDETQLYLQNEECIPIPRLSNILVELTDENIASGQNLGTTWQQVGDIFLEKPELTSKGMNKQNIMKMLKMFDAVSAEEKELAYRIRNLNMANGISEAVLKRNSRIGYVNEPLILSFEMHNPLPNSIEISKIAIHLKTPRKCQITARDEKTEGRYTILAGQAHALSFEIVPQETGLYEFSHISWIFSKVTSIHKFKQPWETSSNLKSLYYKINVLEETGRMKVDMKHLNRHHEGQITEVEFEFRNEGREPIEEVYLAVDNERIFGFKLTKFQFSIAPQQSASSRLKIKIPLFDSKIHSNYWKCINKSIFLYKVGGAFRIFRLVTVFNIYRIADIYHIVCERLSTNLHLLSFSVKYENAEQQKLQILKSLVIDGQFEIKKVETNSFGLAIVQYFFFLRRNDQLDLEEFKFTSHAGQYLPMIRQNYSKKITQEGSSPKAVGSAKQVSSIQEIGLEESRSDSKLQLYFIWQERDNFGIIDPAPISITATENTALKVKLPFNVKIILQDEIEHNFEDNPCLQMQMELKIKNIFDPKDIKVCVELTENVSNDLYFEGITEQTLNLKYNEESRFRVKLILFRCGVYNIARNIRYTVSINKVNSYVINHFEYENIYLIVKNAATTANFDFFNEFQKLESPSFKKSEQKVESMDLL